MSALALIAVGWVISGRTQLPDWPPLPEEGEHVDYIKWYDDARRAGMKPEDDAFPLYRRILPMVEKRDGERPPRVRFSGFWNEDPRPAGFPRPWEPKDHPNWEASYQRTSDVLRELKLAVSRPYYLTPDRWGTSAPAHMLFNLEVPILKELRTCMKGMSEAAWRMDSGRIDPEAFFEYIRAGLRVAGQLEHDPLLIAQLVALAIREMVYEDIRTALRYGVFQQRAVKRLWDELAAEDRPIPSLDLLLRCECSMALDVMQFAFEHDRGGDEEFFGPIRKAIREGDLSEDFCSEEILAYFKTMAEMMATRGQERSRGLILRFRVAMESEESNAVLRVTTAGYHRASQLSDRTETLKRGTRLVVAMHLFRDAQSRWPKKLDELPEQVSIRFGADAPSHKPFVYRLVDGQPLLYALSTNGKDDGGRHDPRWGDIQPDTDFVLWPPQPGRNFLPTTTSAPNDK